MIAEPFREDVTIEEAFSEEVLIEPLISCWVNICDVLMEFVDSEPICALLKAALFANMRPVLKELAYRACVLKEDGKIFVLLR